MTEIYGLEAQAVMSESPVAQLNQLRDALTAAMLSQDWESIQQLDQRCLACVEHIATHAQGVERQALRGALSEVLALYKRLIQSSLTQRDAIGSEITQARRSNRAVRAYISHE